MLLFWKVEEVLAIWSRCGGQEYWHWFVENYFIFKVFWVIFGNNLKLLFWKSLGLLFWKAEEVLAIRSRCDGHEYWHWFVEILFIFKVFWVIFGKKKSFYFERVWCYYFERSRKSLRSGQGVMDISTGSCVGIRHKCRQTEKSTFKSMEKSIKPTSVWAKIGQT